MEVILTASIQQPIKFTIGNNYIADIYKEKYSSKPGYSSGFLLQFNVAKKIVFNTGIGFSIWDETAKYTINDTSFTGDSIIKLNVNTLNQYKYFQIPLSLGYQIKAGQFVKLYPWLGIGIQVLYDYSGIRPNDGKDKIQVLNSNRIQGTTAYLSGGLRASFPINNTLNITSHIAWQQATQSLFENTYTARYYVNFISLGVGISCKF